MLGIALNKLPQIKAMFSSGMSFQFMFQVTA